MDTISIKDYLLGSIKENLHLKEAWIIATFSILPDNSNIEELGITKNSNNVIVSLNNIQYKLDYKDKSKPIFIPIDKISLKKDDLIIIKEDIETVIGVLILNAICILYPYSGKVPFVNGYVKGSELNKIAYNALIIDKIVTIEEHIKFENAVSNLKIFDTLVVPSTTEKSISVPDEVIKYRDELLLKYKDQMHDPAKVAEFQKLIADRYREYLKGDPAENYYIKAKDINMSSMRTKLFYGAEPNFYDETKIDVIQKSLNEGWDVEDMQSIINAIRGGSYARGKETAMGGAEVKVSNRIFQNYTITDDDCLTKKGLNIFITNTNYNKLVGRYLIGNTKPLDEDTLKKNIGKYLFIRSPYLCITGNTTNSTSFCKKCIGDKIANSGIEINAMTTTANSEFMQVFMKLVHTTELSVAKYNYLERMT